ncbi:MAG: RtcB family protein [Ruminococcus sp.]|nr:RtcB family protein [Ruminococcus sp.]
MIEVIGKHNTALCYTDILESSAYGQILAVCNESAFADSKIRIMPDVHAGLGCTIGTTMTVTDKVVPGMVGVDIGCGMETVKIKEKDIDFEKLDTLIRKEIPCGRAVRRISHPLNKEISLKELVCASAVDIEYAGKSIGTLGGGNHFIELDKDSDGNVYLVVHSGSRHLGCEVAKLYQLEGRRAMWGGARHQILEVISNLKEQGRHKEIESTVRSLKQDHRIDIPHELAYVEGRLFDDYIHDMKIVQHFATLNRKAMTDIILEGMGFTEIERFTTIHNYIDTDSMILRKGAVSAKAREKLLIPINMRDGSLICIGKGNEDWNCSAPHGAGRLMSRSAASQTLSMDEYKEQMSGIFTTCISPDTLDESPMAYKSLENIVSNITPTADIVCRITPIYNFKSAE